MYVMFFFFLSAKYDHSQDDINRIRKQTQAIFSDTLVQNGLVRVSLPMHAHMLQLSITATLWLTGTNFSILGDSW